MITRIRYTKHDNILLSKDILLIPETQSLIKVSIDLNNLTADVFDSKNNVLLTLKSKSILTLKMRIKRSLRKMGVKFNDEIRKKRGEVNV